MHQPDRTHARLIRILIVKEVGTGLAITHCRNARRDPITTPSSFFLTPASARWPPNAMSLSRERRLPGVEISLACERRLSAAAVVRQTTTRSRDLSVPTLRHVAPRDHRTCGQPFQSSRPDQSALSTKIPRRDLAGREIGR